jgi:hypothetical protein
LGLSACHLLLAAQNFAVAAAAAAAAWLCQASSSPVSVSQVCTHHKTHMSHTIIYIYIYIIFIYFILFFPPFFLCELPIWVQFFGNFFLGIFLKNLIVVVIYFKFELLDSLHSGLSLSIGKLGIATYLFPKVEKSNDPLKKKTQRDY